MKLLLDEMFSAAIATALRNAGVDAIAVQERAELRGLSDPALFVHAQLDARCVITENIADFMAVDAAWRAEQTRPHHGLILVAPRAFPRHRRGAVGRLARAILGLINRGQVERGAVVWLDASA